MEQKKLLLVTVSVGIFLFIVIGAALLIFPHKKPQVSSPAQAATPPASVDANEWVKNPQAVAGLQSPAQPLNSNSGDVIIIYGQNEPASAPGAATTTAVDGSSVIDVPNPAGAAQPVAPEATKPVAAATADTGAAPSKKTERVQETSGKPKSASTGKTATATTTAKPHHLVDSFWVQTGAYSTRARAEGAKESLSSKGISSLVETRVSGGKTLYRVRIGPYTTKNEADYWLSLVKTLSGFEESYVTVNKSTL